MQVLIGGLLLGVLIGLFVTELATFLTYGWFVKKEYHKYFMNIPDEKIKMNVFDPTILHVDPYIATHWSVFSRYNIHGFGVVLRWSPLHYKINEYYKIGRKKYNKEVHKSLHKRFMT